MSFNTWRNTKQHINLFAFISSKRIQQLKLDKIINDEAADVGIKRHVDFIRRFVVAMEMNTLGREACLQSRIQLSIGNNVKDKSFFLGNRDTLP